MKLATRVREHHAECAPHLGILARYANGGRKSLTQQDADNVIVAARAVLIETRAAEHELIEAADPSIGTEVAEFLSARSRQLSDVTEETEVMARAGNTATLAENIVRLESMTAALQAVQRAAARLVARDEDRRSEY